MCVCVGGGGGDWGEELFLGFLELIWKVLNIEFSRAEQQDLVGIFTLNGTLFFPKGGSGGMGVPWERKRPGDEERVLAARQSLTLPRDKVEATRVYEDTYPQPYIWLPCPVPTGVLSSQPRPTWSVLNVTIHPPLRDGGRQAVTLRAQ